MEGAQHRVWHLRPVSVCCYNLNDVNDQNVNDHNDCSLVSLSFLLT